MVVAVVVIVVQTAVVAVCVADLLRSCRFVLRSDHRDSVAVVGWYA